MSVVDASLSPYNVVVLLVAFMAAVLQTSAQSVMCGQYQNMTSKSGQYQIQNNAWGAYESGSGSQCTTADNEEDGTAFSTTWAWTANSDAASQTQVHSYANIKSRSETLPVMLSNLTALTVSANWTMYPSYTGDPKIFDIEGLSDIGAKADVTLDFFLDPDMKQSTNVTNPAFEVMIWFATLDGTEPIGYAHGAAGSAILEGKNYTLFIGQNSQVNGLNNQPGQQVFSFVAPENMTSFTDLNVLPLFQYLVAGKKMDSTTYLGTAQFGTEALHTDGQQVTFEASGINLTVQAGPPAKAAPTSTAPGKSNTAPAKSIAVSLKGVESFKWCLGMLEGAIGAWMVWSWML